MVANQQEEQPLDRLGDQQNVVTMPIKLVELKTSKPKPPYHLRVYTTTWFETWVAKESLEKYQNLRGIFFF